MRSELDGRSTSLDDLKKLAKTRPLEALRHLGLETEDDMELVARLNRPGLIVTAPGDGD